MRKLLFLVVALLLVLLGLTIFSWDRKAPEIDWTSAAEAVGRDSRITLKVTDSGRGLRSLQVAVLQSGQRQEIFHETYTASGWLKSDATRERDVAFGVNTADGPADLKEGPFEIEVRVDDQPNLWLWSRSTVEKREVLYDSIPPIIEVLSGNHYIRQGGAETVVYRVREKLRASGVEVGDHSFRGYALPSRGPDVYLTLFGMGYDQPADVPMFVWAEDAAGNRARASFHKQIIPVRFRKRDIQIDDSFIGKVAPEILSHTDQVSNQETLEATFLEINSRLRSLNHEQISEISRSSADHILFDRPFLQLTNSQVEASFADERTYYYQGRVIDHQTHQGFDLASLAQSPVESANAGVVLWAGYLGIYGNCVILDHGLGLLSLYGHLSSIDVQKGQAISQGESLGRTGQTGLAGGDHLHYSMILQGLQINPLEWWDPKWVQIHLLGRVEPEKNTS